MWGGSTLQETAVSGFQQNPCPNLEFSRSLPHVCSIPSVSSFNFVAILYGDSVTEAPVIYLYARIPMHV